ncbi:MAG: alpha-amylase [Nitrospirae bacterium]|nr:MAG: alpha-amylase [Nitrospirota bacterium]
MPGVDPCLRPHPHLYEINTWVWLEELSRREGRRIRLGTIPRRECDKLADQGFDGIWLMGIWERSPRGREIALHDPALRSAYSQALPDWRPSDVVGSPYAVHAYRPDPALGSWDELASTRAMLHERGLRLILDFVPNHTALDHEWVTAHPDWYIQGTAAQYARSPFSYFPITVDGTTFYLAHGKDPYFPAWTDTAQLNYFHPETRAAVLRELQTLAEYADGLRCDMAMLVLNEIFARTWGSHGLPNQPSQEFWAEAIARYPSLIWIAEVYWNREQELQSLGFHFTYDKPLYDRLRFGHAVDIRQHLMAEAAYQAKLVRFMENHDEPRSAAVFGPDRLPAVASLVAALPGMRLYHHGQFEGRRIRLPVQLGRAPDEQPDPEIMQMYERLLRITDTSIFHVGCWTLVPVHPAPDESAHDLIAYAWLASNDVTMVVVNLGAATAHAWLALHETLSHVIDRAKTYVVRDRWDDREERYSGRDLLDRGPLIRVDPFEARFLALYPVDRS